MKNIYFYYSAVTNKLYVYSKKNHRDKQDVTERFADLARQVYNLSDNKEIKIGDLVLQIKEKRHKSKRRDLQKDHNNMLSDHGAVYNKVGRATQDDLNREFLGVNCEKVRCPIPYSLIRGNI